MLQGRRLYQQDMIVYSGLFCWLSEQCVSSVKLLVIRSEYTILPQAPGRDFALEEQRRGK